MPLHKHSIERLVDATFTAPTIAELFEQMVQRPTIPVVLTWHQEDDDFEEDDYIPVLSLSLLKASDLRRSL